MKRGKTHRRTDTRIDSLGGGWVGEEEGVEVCVVCCSVLCLYCGVLLCCIAVCVGGRRKGGTIELIAHEFHPSKKENILLYLWPRSKPTVLLPLYFPQAVR